MARNERIKAPEASETGDSPNEPEEVHAGLGTLVVVASLCLVLGFAVGRSTSQPRMVPTRRIASAPPGGGKHAPGAHKGLPPATQHQIDALKRQLADRPESVKDWIRLGNLSFDVNNYAEAISAYERALELDPNNPSVWTDLGVMYRRSKRPLDAIDAFDRAIAIDPKHIHSRFNKGVVYLHDMRDEKRALENWEKLAEIDATAKAPSGASIQQLVDDLRAKLAARSEASEASAESSPEAAE